MINRRTFLQRSLQATAAIALADRGTSRTDVLAPASTAETGVEVNDVQSRLNATRVRQIIRPTSLDSLQDALHTARRDNLAVSIAGGRHAMGGQQFGSQMLLLDMKRMNAMTRFDRERGLLTVQGGAEWPEIMEYLQREQNADPQPWAIREKQTGVDRVSIGGSLSANAHGRGLRFPPIIGDVESFILVDAAGKAWNCSRKENPELFALAIGGYGLFGIIALVTLRLARRTKVERVVEIIPVMDLLSHLDQRLAEKAEYGDCQYSTDLTTTPEEHMGVLSCYRPAPADAPIKDNHKTLGEKDWMELYKLARTDKKEAFRRYSSYYQQTNGQVYWSDTHQLAGNFQSYRDQVPSGSGTEMITEVYVSRDALMPFLSAVRKDFLAHQVDMTYGTIRFIEKDSESFLPWAKQKSVCIVCNLHVLHTESGIKKAAEDFRRIIDRAIEFQGSYYLTYHRWATRRQLETCYPRFKDFLALKMKYDPPERFQSNWYRHHRDLFRA